LKRRLSEDKERYYVDSNVFFYAKIMDRNYGPSCAEVIKSIHGGRILAATSTLVALEVANALRKFGLSREVRDTVDSIFSLRIQFTSLEQSDLRNAINTFHKYLISPYDCAHLAMMKRLGAQVIISADKDFDKVAEIKRRNPKSFIED
jgi:predicted nucleic acid-binding protein